jgi:cyclase
MMFVRFVVLSSLATAPAVAQQAPYETTRIAEGVYQFRWQGHNGFFVVTEGGVVAVDPISTEAAARFAAEIERVAPGRPLVAIVYSHSHADHATGAQVLRDAFDSEAPTIAHENAVAYIREAGDPALPVPELTFGDELTLHFGGRPIELHYLGPSHGDDMIVALLPEDSIAFAVDFLANDRVGYRDLGSHHFPEFFSAVRGLLDLPFTRIVFGHGPPGDRAAVERQLDYYSDLREVVEEGVEAGLTEDQAAERVRLPEYDDWSGYKEWFPLNVRGMYRWVSAQRAR